MGASAPVFLSQTLQIIGSQFPVLSRPAVEFAWPVLQVTSLNSCNSRIGFQSCQKAEVAAAVVLVRAAAEKVVAPVAVPAARVVAAADHVRRAECPGEIGRAQRGIRLAVDVGTPRRPKDKNHQS